MAKQARLIKENKKAFFNYEINKEFEAGVVLNGAEVKAVKQGNVRLKGSYVRILRGEAYLVNATIGRYSKSSQDCDPQRTRKLLLRKEQLNYLVGALSKQGFSLVPLRIYEKNGKIKIGVGLGKGRTEYDKKRVLKERQEKRDMQRVRKDLGI